MKTELFIIEDDGTETKIEATNIIIGIGDIYEYNNLNIQDVLYKYKDLDMRNINSMESAIYELKNYHDNNYIDVPILTHKQRQPHYQKFNRVKT